MSKEIILFNRSSPKMLEKRFWESTTHISLDLTTMQYYGRTSLSKELVEKLELKLGLKQEEFTTVVPKQRKRPYAVLNSNLVEWMEVNCLNEQTIKVIRDQTGIFMNRIQDILCGSHCNSEEATAIAKVFQIDPMTSFTLIER